MPMLKDLMADKCYLEKSIIKNYNIIINGKKIYDQELVLISNDTKKLKNSQEDNVKITLKDVY